MIKIGLFILGAALTIVGAFDSVAKNRELKALRQNVEVLRREPARFGNDKSDKLGALTTTGDFPRKFTDPVDGDVINAGDWRNIEYTIGSTTLRNSSSSNATTSIFYLLSNASSVDPGHLHSSAGISSTISIAKGGRGTSTAPTADGQVVVSSATTTELTYTNALPNCNGAIGDKLLYASTTRTWSCGADQGALTMVLIGSSTVSSASTTISVTLDRAYPVMMVLVHASGSTPSHGPSMLFNNNVDSIYSYRNEANGAAQTAASNAARMELIEDGQGVNLASSSLATIWITNGDASRGDKRARWEMGRGALDLILGMGTWATTTAISTIQFTGLNNGWASSTDPGYSVGSWIKVYGN